MPTDDSSPQWSSHPAVECSQLRPRHHGTEVSCPPCTWFEFLTYRVLEHKKWLFFIVEFQGGLSHSNSNWNRDPGSFCHIALQSRVLFLHVFFTSFTTTSAFQPSGLKKYKKRHCISLQGPSSKVAQSLLFSSQWPQLNWNIATSSSRKVGKCVFIPCVFAPS